MNSITKSLLGVSAGVILGGCADRDPQAVATPGNTEITAAIVEAGRETRSAIDQTEYAGGAIGIIWTPEDRLGVFSASSLNAPFTNADNAKAGRVKFKGDLSGTPLYAYYPYSEINNGRSADNLAGTLPLSQQWDANTQEIAGDYKFGTPRNGAENEFDFTHLFSLLKFTVNATGTAIQGETLKSVSMTLPSDRVLGGDFTFSAIDGKYNFGTTTDANKITLNWTSPIALSTGISATGYMSCAPDIQENDELTITVSTDRQTATFTAHAAFAFEAGSVYSFNLNLKEIEDKFGLTVEAIPTEPEEETANCYMITTAGEHDFKATVIGNGEKGIIKGAGFHTEDPYINPASAKLLWEDVQGFISDVRLIDGRVHYTATGNVGNAVIAVYSGTDGKGDILWSWHIWGVGDTLPQDEEITNRNGAVFNMMDRTLGVHSLTSYNATLYQWGRKDPIPNSIEYFVDGKSVNIEESYPVFEGSDVTILTGIRNPDKLITLPYVESNHLLWGDNDITDIYTFGYPNYLDAATAEQTIGWTDQKTIYDPSPVGYRVASKYAWTGFVNNKKGDNESVGNTRLSQVNFVKYENGFYFKKNTDDTVGTYYPQAGSRGAATGSLWVGGNSPYSTLNYTASYWSSAPQKNKGYAQRLQIGIYKDPNGGTVANSYNTVNTLDFAYCENAFAVRCVRE